ncbi:uncharacterized protein LOC113235775 [Hyposmocoma kahamanoa]|uniref:uncharacterized protein LOC113235775 n=1 Tax=Hyposmocoma kahamanoa TaxID=1477025 RepID=UPI000E6D5DFA|nr:uncharacterized protein LOC113235775 [Hyposmocoma kahamanoa]
MSEVKSECDASIIIGLLVVFALPLTLLVPGFSVWNVVPKLRVTRFHIFAQQLDWCELNAVIIALLALFFCLYLEIRKRKLDDLVESVLMVNQATDKTMDVERERQTAAVRVCVDLLDASGEHYENLLLLQGDLRHRKQRPPSIQPSGSDM